MKAMSDMVCKTPKRRSTLNVVQVFRKDKLDLHSFRPVAVRTLSTVGTYSRATDCCRFYYQKDHPDLPVGTAGSQQVLKNRNEALATEVNAHAREKQTK